VSRKRVCSIAHDKHHRIVRNHFRGLRGGAFFCGMLAAFRDITSGVGEDISPTFRGGDQSQSSEEST
jgi:hypothetical protein